MVAHRRWLALVTALLLAPSCAQDVGDIDRSQPGLLAKSVFDGEWFMRRTVVEVPYDVGYTFVGEQEEVQRIRWNIQEELLIAFRVTPLVEGTTDSAPVAVFAIEDHVDLIRSYDAATGEQTNVIEEDTSDRMWFERDYIRVDWSKNLVSNFAFTVDGLAQEPVGYFVEDGDDSDRLLLGVREANGAWTDVQDDVELRDLEEAHYIDVVTKVFLQPEEIYVEDWFGDVYTEPACWYYLNYDCLPGVIAVRNAFLRTDVALSDYAPLTYPDNAIARDEDDEPIVVRWTENGDLEPQDETVDPTSLPASSEQPSQGPSDPYAQSKQGGVVRLPFFDKFGYFRIERFGYDSLYGEVESSRIYHITRWNLWGNSHDEDGEVLPYAERTPKPIVYYLSPDFPESLLPSAQQTIDQWDEAFRSTVGTLQGDSDPPRMFELRQNTRQVDPETGEVIRRGEVIGDLRYSHLYLVLEPTRAGLLGYGPSAADPLTGEIFAADAFVYWGGVQELAAKGRDIVALINGDLDPETLALGNNVQDYLATLAQGGAPSAPSNGATAKAFAKSHAHGPGGASFGHRRGTSPSTRV